MNKITMWLLIAAFALLAVACQAGGQAGGDDLSQREIRAVATIGMITDAVEKVGGERVRAVGLMGSGVDPHLYKASEGDVTRLREADVIFYNGLHLEAQMGDVLERMADTGVTTVAVAEAIDPQRLVAPAEYEGNYDPHVWFDVTMWQVAVGQIRDALAELDPEHAELYRANAEAYLEELEQLHVYVREQAERVPAERRVLVTAHDAFNYFGMAYGFEVRGLQGISTQTEASIADVQALAEFIAERRIPAIFVESSVPRRTVEALQAAVRSRGFDVTIGGELFSDAMGNPGTPEGTYVGMVRHNVDTIVEALLGQ